MTESRYFTKLQRVTGWEKTATGIVAEVDEARLAIDLLRPDTFRFEITPAHGGVDAPQYAVCADVASMRTPFSVKEKKGRVELATDQVRVTVHLDPFRLEAHRADGSAIFETSEDGNLGSYAQLNDSFIVTRMRGEDDVILGLGEKTGRLNRAGRHMTLWNVDVLNPSARREIGACDCAGGPSNDPRSTEYDPYYISIPFYQTVDEKGNAAGFFVDNLCRAEYDFATEDETRILFYGGRYVEYFFAGPRLENVLEAYTALTGRMGTPPLWSLGYHHCRWHPYSQEDVLKHAKTYRKKGIPCDSIWLDIDHMNGYRVFTWNPKLLPEPAKMLSSLTKLGFRSVTIIDPGVKVEPGYSVYDSGLAKNAFCRTEGGAVYQGQVWPGKTAFPDFASAVAREWWGELNAKHIQFGLAGIWNDMNEPATGDIPASAMRFDGGKYSHGMYHNGYAMLMAMGTAEGLKKALPNQRPFVLSRAGSAGIQRYAANWLGDNMSRWEHLAMSLPMSLGLGLSGQPFIGADIGGFGENSSPELLVRWMQVATLTPFCRNHNDAGNVDQYPWSFGAKTEAACHAAIDLRYRLMPYLYTTFVESATTGLPIMRPLLMEDLSLSEVDDEYLFGSSLLIAPVLAPKVRARSVALPSGEWIDWWTGARCEGTVWSQAPLDRIPLFARAGSVVPMWTEAPPSTMGYHPEVVELRVFVPSVDGEWGSMLVEDDGESFAFERGERLTTTIRVVRKGKKLSVVGSTVGVVYAGFARKAFRLVFRGADLADVVVEAGVDGFEWSGTV
ncbi:MAG: DUF4968 domain-containing protein [Armatimonadetes bacterium]|nr:DUF4968 domain-containing protein [Armatimonadota bacterium]